MTAIGIFSLLICTTIYSSCIPCLHWKAHNKLCLFREIPRCHHFLYLSPQYCICTPPSLQESFVSWKSLLFIFIFLVLHLQNWCFSSGSYNSMFKPLQNPDLPSSCPMHWNQSSFLSAIPLQWVLAAIGKNPSWCLETDFGIISNIESDNFFFGGQHFNFYLFIYIWKWLHDYLF